MPLGTCVEIDAANNGLEQTKENPLPNGSGSILITVRYHPGPNATRENRCDGPLYALRVRNTGTQPGWAMLPEKKKGDPWYKIDAGTDATIDTTVGTPGQRNAAQKALDDAGMTNYSDVSTVRFQFTDPSA